MIEEYLLNYGILGLWTISLIYEKITFQKQMKALIERNNLILDKVQRKLK